MKCNHGSGFNVICLDKSTLDWEETKKTVNEWLDTDYSALLHEIHYKDVPRKVVCEKYIGEGGVAPTEYQFWCLNGTPESILACRKNLDQTYDAVSYSLTWERLFDRIGEDETVSLAKPACGLEPLIKYAKILAEPFPFIRVDFYVVGTTIYLAEMTFTPSANLLTNYKQSFLEFKARAEKGDKDAMFFLGKMYSLGKYVTKDNTAAVKWYREAAEKGDAKAQYTMGVCYSEGTGVAKSYEEAVKWYRQAADQNNADAQCALGTCFEEGNGVEPSATEAVKWYRLSAEQGNADAQCNLGYCYDEGIGVEQSLSDAVRWYRLSAEQGNATAQNNLGYCYEHGSGVEQSEEEAIKWYKFSAKQGNEGAIANLKAKGITDFNQ